MTTHLYFWQRAFVVIAVIYACLVPLRTNGVDLKPGDIVVLGWNGVSGDGFSGNIVKIDPQTGMQTLITENGYFTNSIQEQLVLTDNGNILVSSSGNFLTWTTTNTDGQIIRVLPEDGSQSIIYSNGLLMDPAGLTIHDDGTLYVGNTISPSSANTKGRIIKIDPATSNQTQLLEASVHPPARFYMEPDGNIIVANSVGVIFRVDITNGSYANVFGGSPLSMAYGTIKLNDHEYLIADAGVHPGGMMYANEATGAITNISESGGTGNICNSVYLGQSNQLFIANDVYFGNEPTLCLLDMTSGARNAFSTGGYLGDIYDIKVYIYPDPILFSIPRPIVPYRGLTNVQTSYSTYKDQTIDFSDLSNRGRLTFLGMDSCAQTALIHIAFSNPEDTYGVYTTLLHKGYGVATNGPWLEKLGSDLIIEYSLPRASTEYYFSWDFSNWITGGVRRLGYLPCPLTENTGIPTLWLESNGITNDFEAQSLLDHDQDGYETWKEYYLGTVPTNSQSCLNFCIGSMSGTVCMAWDAHADRQYEIHKTTKLNGEWNIVTNIVAPCVPTNRYFSYSTNEFEYYRVSVAESYFLEKKGRIGFSVKILNNTERIIRCAAFLINRPTSISARRQALKL